MKNVIDKKKRLNCEGSESEIIQPTSKHANSCDLLKSSGTACRSHTKKLLGRSRFLGSEVRTTVGCSGDLLRHGEEDRVELC